MKTTGAYSIKPYRCRHCGHESQIGTNHWGATYGRCAGCSWKRPLDANCHDCLEAPPPGVGLPAEWPVVKLGDIVEVL